MDYWLIGTNIAGYFVGAFVYRTLYRKRLRDLKALYATLFDVLYLCGTDELSPGLLNYCSDGQVLKVYRESQQNSRQFKVADTVVRQRKLPPYRMPSE